MIVNKPLQRVYKCGSRKYYMVGNGVVFDTIKSLGKRALRFLIPHLRDKGIELVKNKAVEIIKSEVPKFIENQAKKVMKKVKGQAELSRALGQKSSDLVLDPESRGVLNNLLKPRDPLMLGEGFKLLS